MSKILVLALLLLTHASSAHAISTAASFDLSYGIATLSVNTLDGNGVAAAGGSRTLTSNSAVQIDYNVALFDYKTVATLSFTQLGSSNLGSLPFTRIGLGASYHFIRVNGQRVILDNQVEAKIWGISPAFELTMGLSVLSIKDPTNSSLDFTASAIDLSPRLLLEIPMTSSFLLMLRAGLISSLGGNGPFGVKYSGSIFNVGVKLTTL